MNNQSALDKLSDINFNSSYGGVLTYDNLGYKLQFKDNVWNKFTDPLEDMRDDITTLKNTVEKQKETIRSLQVIAEPRKNKNLWTRVKDAIKARFKRSIGEHSEHLSPDPLYGAYGYTSSK